MTAEADSISNPSQTIAHTAPYTKLNGTGNALRFDMAHSKNLSCTLPRFSPKSIDSVAEILTGTDSEKRALAALLADPEERFNLLDSPSVQTTVNHLERKIEDSLFCYVVVRQQLLHAGITNRPTAIYLSNIWCGYRESGILPDLSNQGGPLVETVDILRELNFVKGYEKFELLAMSGNYFLFLMAFFEGYFEELESNMHTPVAYYEAFARISYRAACDHGLCEEFELKQVCNDLSERFKEIKSALSRLGRAQSISTKYFPTGAFGKTQKPGAA